MLVAPAAVAPDVVNDCVFPPLLSTTAEPLGIALANALTGRDVIAPLVESAADREPAVAVHIPARLIAYPTAPPATGKLIGVLAVSPVAGGVAVGCGP